MGRMMGVGEDNAPIYTIFPLLLSFFFNRKKNLPILPILPK